MEKKKVMLSLNKEIIAKLSNGEMYSMKGGALTLPHTVCVTDCVWTCAVTCICTKQTGACC